MLASAVFLTGCSASETDSNGAGPSPDTESSLVEPAEPTESPEPSEPAIPVADGEVRTVETLDPAVGDLVRYRLPTARWEASDVVPAAGTFRLPSGVFYTISGVSQELVADTSLEAFRRVTLGAVGPPAEPRVAAAPNRSVDGVEGYVVRGEGPEGFYYEFGALYRGHIVVIEFTFPRSGERSEGWVESVLASVEWL